ncbi:MAG: hypothetical protein LBS21_14170 [Clostridiales bacterium]|jgi:ABC-type multidrug transport system fused ATPase/permease subunit|nr:hypothetical protein [Clostridiales bacterium]
MRSLFKLMRKRKLLTLAAAAFSVLSSAVTIWWSAQVGGIIDVVSAGNAPDEAAILTALLTILATGIIKFSAGYTGAYTCEILSRDLRMGYARYFAALPFVETEKLNAGEELSGLQNEIGGVTQYLNGNLFHFFNGIISFLLCFTWLLRLNPALTLFSNLPVFFILIYIAWASKAIGVLTEYSQQAKAGMNRHAETLLTLFPVMRLYNAQSLAQAGYGNALNEWERKTVRLERTRARLLSLSGVLSRIPLLLLFLIGGAMAIAGDMSVGEAMTITGGINIGGAMAIAGDFSVGTLYAFVLLYGNVSGALMNMPGQITAFRQFSANMNRLGGRLCL